MYILNDFLFSIDIENIELNYDNPVNIIKYNINPSLQQYLYNIKKEINKNLNSWDEYKKITNKYEYINTPVFTNKIKTSVSVCSYKPISRSYFKMIEILNQFNFNFCDNIKSFHLAEGPGGFIEALSNFRSCKEDLYVGMTLIDEHTDIPKWNKIQQFMKKNTNIKLEYGPKQDGNLYFKHNLLYLKKNYSNQYDFITGDGGFDYSNDFNKQEESSINLIFCEIIYALVLQKQHGSFVLKIFDIFHDTTIELLFLLSYFYKQVFVYKPNTSREANSEKYIICKDFNMNKNYHIIIEKICTNFQDLTNKQLYGLFNFKINSYFLNKIQEINAIYGQQQLENILNTINFIQDKTKLNVDKIEKIKETNIEKCIKWCKNHNLTIKPIILQNYVTNM